MAYKDVIPIDNIYRAVPTKAKTIAYKVIPLLDRILLRRKQDTRLHGHDNESGSGYAD
jgi:hypothetical protein